VYADIAGLKDTNGDIIEVLNTFLTKCLFVKAISVRFIITITIQMVKEGRGQMVREQIETVREICMGNLTDLINSLQPLITKIEKN
jgi:hypothetical protein